MDAQAPCGDVLQTLEQYEARAEYIRKALSEASQENEDAAFEMVSVNVLHSQRLFNTAKELASVIPAVLKVLADTDDEKSPVLVQQQAICYQLANLFDYVLRADELKMLRPGLQNDFSFYRRALPKHALDPDVPVKDEDASFISMFLANPCPMMTQISRAVERASNDDERLVEQVAAMANACLLLIKARKFPENSPNYVLCLRAMVGCIVIFDAVNPEGVFYKNSPVQIRAASNMLARDFKKEFPTLPDPSGLLNIVRYSCKHFDDSTTPAAITQLFEDE